MYVTMYLLVEFFLLFAVSTNFCSAAADVDAAVVVVTVDGDDDCLKKFLLLGI